MSIKNTNSSQALLPNEFRSGQVLLGQVIYRIEFWGFQISEETMGLYN